MFKKIYDISVALGTESIDYPGDTPFSRKPLAAIEKGDPFDLSRLVMSAHSGTHIDAPSHFIRGGKTIDAYSAEDFILPAHVVAVPNKESIGAEDIIRRNINPGEAILFKTENSANGRSKSGRFSDHYVYLTPEGAACCVGKKVGLVGLDYITIEPFGDNAFTAHHTLLENGIPVLEGIDLNLAPEGRYLLVCPPLKIKGAEASPARALLCV